MTRKTLTFAQMECLCAVAEAGSLTAAANNMHLVQSSLSRTMSDIENAVGTPILARSARGVSLTVAGEELYSVSTEILSSRDVGMRRFHGFMEGRRGHVSIATLPSLVFQLAPVVRQFGEENPDVSFSMKDGVSSSIISKVHSGIADFGITSHGMLPETLKEEALLRTECMSLFRGITRSRNIQKWNGLSSAQLGALRRQYVGKRTGQRRAHWRQRQSWRSSWSTCAGQTC